MNNSNQEKILRIFFENPTQKFHIRELARKIKLNPNTIINLIEKLEKKGLVLKEREKHLVNISLNFNNKKTIQKKRIFNIESVYNSGVVEFLLENFNPQFISIIGSYSRGEDIEKSDIDLVIKTNKEKLFDLTKFEKYLNRRIHLLFLPDKVSEEFFNNLINGIVVYGVLRR